LTKLLTANTKPPPLPRAGKGSSFFPLGQGLILQVEPLPQHSVLVKQP